MFRENVYRNMCYIKWIGNEICKKYVHRKYEGEKEKTNKCIFVVIERNRKRMEDILNVKEQFGGKER